MVCQCWLFKFIHQETNKVFQNSDWTWCVSLTFSSCQRICMILLRHRTIILTCQCVAVNTECSKGKEIHADVCILVKYKIFHWVGGHYDLHLTSYSQSCYGTHTLFVGRLLYAEYRCVAISVRKDDLNAAFPIKNLCKKKSRALLFLLEMYFSTLWLLQHKEKQSITIMYTHCVGFCSFRTPCINRYTQWHELPIQCVFFFKRVIETSSHNT